MLLGPIFFYVTLANLNLASSAVTLLRINLPATSYNTLKFYLVLSIDTTSPIPTGNPGSLLYFPFILI